MASWGSGGPGEPHEFNRFMATSLEAFDAMKDAVAGNQFTRGPIGTANLTGASDSVAIIGEEGLVAKVCATPFKSSPLL